MQSVSGLPRTQAPVAKKPKLLSYLLLLAIFALIVWGISRLFSSNDNQDDGDDKVTVVDKNSNQQENNEDSDVEENPVDPSGESTDFSEFSTARQSVGVQSDSNEYTLMGIVDSANNGFHRFVFELSAKDGGTQAPNVIVDYRASLGAVRVSLNGTTTDNSGIGYQNSRSVDREGITRLYHNVSADQTEELYDIGVVSSTPFYLYMSESSSGLWKVTVDVRYPGASDVDVDGGTGEFSKDEQTLSGGSSSDGARVTSYSYTTSGGVLSLVFGVSGSSSKPIPSAIAKYDGDVLVLEFPSLLSDTITKDGNPFELPSGIKVETSFSSGKSVYRFEGVKKEFKLGATRSPNQVVLEIRL